MNQNENDENGMTCAEFQAQMPDLIGSGENIAAHPHLETCARCTALLADLESIAEAARQLFPVDEPPDSIWDHIESAIKGDAKPEKTDAAINQDDNTAPHSLSPEPA